VDTLRLPLPSQGKRSPDSFGKHIQFFVSAIVLPSNRIFPASIGINRDYIQ
jgi:hypothetical protein